VDKFDDWIVRIGMLLTVAMLAVLFAAMVVVLFSEKAAAHDIYNGVRDHRNVLCCGGDPVTGDCEALEAEQIVYRAGQNPRMYSKRYKAWITVSQGIVLPTSIPGDKGAAGHYCGVRRSGALLTMPVTEDQPDPLFHTYCAFLAPGGV
jgi:hypothetical protein